MVNKVNKDAFKKLKKLKPAKRMEMARSPVGQSMLSLLTPSQFADLFPRYYEQGLPNVEGFRKAISKKSQEKQQEYFDSLDEKLGTTSPGAAERTGRQGATRRGGGGGGSITSSGNLATNQREAYQAALAEGLSPSAAKILVANMSGESLRNPADHHWDRSHMSQGIVQWDPRRAEIIKNQFGAYPKDMSVAQQTKAAIWEMKKYYPSAWNDLTNESLGSRERMYGVVSKYEIPADKQGATDLRMRHLSGLNVEGGGREGATPSAGAGVTTDMVGKAFPNAKGNTECVAYAQQAGGVGHTSGWSPGAHAGTGNLKPGAWIATFQDGKYTNTYGQSHVARFESYIYDNSGKIIGMNVTHQYNRSGKVISGQMMFGSGGEMDASNYYQIHDNGRPASMKVSDGTDVKVQERKQYFKNHPEADDSDQVKSTTKVQTQPAVAAPPPPMPHPAASSPTTPTATVNKPTSGSFNVNKDAFLAKIREMEPLANMAGEERIRSGFNDDPRVKKAGVHIDENWQMHAKDVNNSDFKEATKDFGGGIIKPLDKRSEAPSNKQTASLDADAHFMKAAYSPGGDNVSTTSVGAQMRGKIEEYYGKKMSDREYEMLIRATHAESTARGHSPEEHAMIMGSILNRAKKKGGVDKALMARSQFESVTGRAGRGFHPNAAYKAGPSVERMGAINEGVMNHLHRVPSNQEYFASATVKTKFLKKSILPGKFGTPQRHADTWFGNTLLPETKNKVAETPTTGAIPMDSTVNRGDKTPTTPKTTVEPPKPSTTDRIAKEIFQGGGKGAEAAPAKPTTTTPTTTSATTPVAPPAPPTNGSIRTEPVLNVDNPVRGASDGGSFDANGTVSIRPMDRKDDHALISNNGGRDQVIGTVQSGERIDVTPQQKVSGNMGPTDNGLRGEFEALRQEIGNNLSNAGEPVKQQPKTIQQKPDANVTKFNASLNEQNKNKQWHNDAFARAMARTRLQETGDTLNNHFSGGNTNYG